MADEDITNKFVRSCVVQAASLANSKQANSEAALLILNIANDAIKNVRKAKPPSEYFDRLCDAIECAYGVVGRIPHITERKQHAAIRSWAWVEDVTGRRVDEHILNVEARYGHVQFYYGKTFSDLIAVMRSREDGWQERIAEMVDTMYVDYQSFEP